VSFTWQFDRPFYTGLALSPDVPAKYPIALAGHPYMLDMEADVNGLRGQYFRRSSVPLLRSQADQSNTPNESSISPDDMWRRTQDSWHLGAGQTHLDRSNSSPYRFRSSKGVNVWTKWQATLLPDTSKVLTSANNVRMVTAGSRTYLIDGQNIKYSTNITAASPSFTTVTGTPAATPTAITTDGYTVYVSYPSALYTTNTGTSAATATSVTQAFSLLGYAKGRLMGASANVLYNITTTASNPTALFTHPNSDFTWVAFTPGPSSIYAMGYSGDKSLFYRTNVKPDGTTLDIPVVCGELPDGEIVRSALGYLGYVILGSDAGVRLGTPDSAGNITVGGLIPTSSAVKCLVGYSRFVWFGWTNYDTTSTGLGRLDLSVFTDVDTPAYASDLMATTQGVVGSVVIVGGTAVFAVDAVGIYAPTSNLVASGTLDSGLIAYDLADPKTAMFMNVKVSPLPAGATVATGLNADSGSFTTVGTVSVTGTTGPNPDYTVGQRQGETFEIRNTLTYATDHTTGPTLTRYTLRSYPTPSRSYEWTLPLLIHEQEDPYGGAAYPTQVAVETEFLFNLLNSLVTLQVGNQSFQVFVEDVEGLPYQLTADRTAYSSTVVVHCKQPAAI
jgi:hypothetical protein